jgi:hypothetical protein
MLSQSGEILVAPVVAWSEAEDENHIYHDLVGAVHGLALLTPTVPGGDKRANRCCDLERGGSWIFPRPALLRRAHDDLYMMMDLF